MSFSNILPEAYDGQMFTFTVHSYIYLNWLLGVPGKAHPFSPMFFYLQCRPWRRARSPLPSVSTTECLCSSSWPTHLYRPSHRYVHVTGMQMSQVCMYYWYLYVTGMAMDLICHLMGIHMSHVCTRHWYVPLFVGHMYIYKSKFARPIESIGILNRHRISGSVWVSSL